jgi:hypothetical protein
MRFWIERIHLCTSKRATPDRGMPFDGAGSWPVNG